MRLIDANALLEHIKDLPTWWADGGGIYGQAMKYPEGMFDVDDVVASIENAPTLTQPNEWISVEDEVPSDDDDGLEFFCTTNATGKGGGVLPLEWEVATIRGKTVRRWRWLNRISPWTVTHWMKRPAPPDRRPPEGEV